MLHSKAQTGQTHRLARETRAERETSQSTRYRELETIFSTLRRAEIARVVVVEEGRGALSSQGKKAQLKL